MDQFHEFSQWAAEAVHSLNVITFYDIPSTIHGAAS